MVSKIGGWWVGLREELRSGSRDFRLRLPKSLQGRAFMTMHEDPLI